MQTGDEEPSTPEEWKSFLAHKKSVEKYNAKKKQKALNWKKNFSIGDCVKIINPQCISYPLEGESSDRLKNLVTKVIGIDHREDSWWCVEINIEVPGYFYWDTAWMSPGGIEKIC